MSTLAPTAQAAVERINRLAFSAEEAAVALGVSRATIFNWLRDGTLQSVKVNGRRLISRAHIDALLAGE
jgi:excisionase family DNA binding protein